MLLRIQNILLLMLLHAPWALLPAMPLVAMAMWAFGR